jgi:hypothetical protein
MWRYKPTGISFKMKHLAIAADNDMAIQADRNITQNEAFGNSSGY